MNTLTTATQHLDAREIAYRIETGGTAVIGSLWLAIIISTGPDRKLRIYSNDVEASLTIAVQTANGNNTGESITITATNARTIATAIGMMIALHTEAVAR